MRRPTGQLDARRIKVVIADDHREMLAEVRGILGDEFEVVETVGDGVQAVRAVLTWDPDILLTDISMPGLNGLQATRTIRKANARVKVVIMTIQEDRDFVTASLSAGATGYVTKGRLSHDLVFALHEAMEGRMFVSNLGAI